MPLRSLYERHRGTLYATLLRIVRDERDAEEILQDVFLAAWMRADRYDARRGPIRGWLMSMARSRALDRLRHDRTRSSYERQTPEPLAPAGVFEQVCSFADQRRLGVAMEALPATQREVIALAYFDGLSLPEVARLTAVPLGTVKTRARLALEKLAAALGDR